MIGCFQPQIPVFIFNDMLDFAWRRICLKFMAAVIGFEFFSIETAQTIPCADP